MRFVINISLFISLLCLAPWSVAQSPVLTEPSAPPAVLTPPVAPASASALAEHCEPGLRIQQHCPVLWQQLEQSGLRAELALSEDTVLDSQMAQQIDAYLAAQQLTPPVLTPLDQSALDRIVKQNYRKAVSKEKGWLEQLMDWWESLFKGEESGQSTDFFSKLMPGETAARLIFYLILGLFIATIGVLGWRELKPFLEANRALRARKTERLQAALSAWPPSIAGLTPDVAMAKLFASLVKLQTARAMLPDVPGLTHFELAQRYQHLPTKDAFGELCKEAAAALFAAVPVNAPMVSDFQRRADVMVAAIAKDFAAQIKPSQNGLGAANA